MGNIIKITSVVWLILLGWVYSSSCQAESMDKAPIDAKLAAITDYRQGMSQAPLIAVEDLIRQTQDQRELRLYIRQQMSALLEKDVTLDCRWFICEQLWFLGPDDALPALARMLKDGKTADMACYALGLSPSPETDKMLRETMEQVEGKLLVAIVNLLGERRDRESAEAVSKLVFRTDESVSEAALAALSKIGGETARKTLVKAISEGNPRMRTLATQAYLQYAEGLLSQGKSKQALDIYEELSNTDESSLMRGAAIRGLVGIKGAKAMRPVISALREDDPVMKRSAIGCIRMLQGTDVIELLAQELPKLGPELQVLLLGTLADMGNSAALPTITASARSSNAEVRIAGLRALGTIGDASSVELLTDAATKGNSQGEKITAQYSLRTLSGKDIDVAIIKNMMVQDIKDRPVLMDILADRDAVSAVPVLLGQAAAPNGAVSKSAFQALARLAGEKDLSSMVELLANLKTEEARNAAERAMVMVSRKIIDEDKRADTVRAAYGGARQTTVRCSLLRVLGDIANSKARAVLQTAVNDKDSSIQDTAVRALANWPNATATGALIEVIKNTNNETYRILALRGYVRLLNLPGERPAGETLKMYAAAMDYARQTAEIKLILSGLANISHPQALQMVRSYLENETVRDEAALAAVKIARVIMGACRNEVRATMGKLLAVTNDDKLRQQAEEILNQINRYGDFITSWIVSGPYLEEEKNYEQLFDIAFAPETNNHAGIEWQIMPVGTSADKSWVLDLGKFFGEEPDRAAYLKTWIYSDKQQKVSLELGSDDGAKVWLNGKVIHANNTARGLTPGEDKITINLDRGRNALLVKITQASASWGFCGRLLTEDGVSPEGIRVDCMPGENTREVDWENIKAIFLFDGKSFAGWEGNLEMFRIEDGAIVAGNLDKNIPRNEFLCTQKEYADFELHLQVKLSGDKSQANAGIQFRSRRIPGQHEVSGYQADMGQQYWGCLYDESRRNKILARANQAELNKILRPDDWNDYVIRCVGKRIQLWINGYQTVDYTETEYNIEQTGIIGLQIHGGAPSEAWYRNIKIKEI